MTVKFLFEVHFSFSSFVTDVHLQLCYLFWNCKQNLETNLISDLETSQSDQKSMLTISSDFSKFAADKSMSVSILLFTSNPH
nr:hypothetical protein Iba_scaffold34447CG0010 [Ipomoea batatas]GMD49059.1 hypothetical protein Iba_chr11aCG0100 [Ipomoea batatas]GME19305.1 hypothetical protein Iba_scaffold22433CG0040 [Ipomoea batatas]